MKELHTIPQQIEAFARLKEISDYIVGLKANLELFPDNRWIIENLERERAALIKEYIHIAHAYP